MTNGIKYGNVSNVFPQRKTGTSKNIAKFDIQKVKKFLRNKKNESLVEVSQNFDALVGSGFDAFLIILVMIIARIKIHRQFDSPKRVNKRLGDLKKDIKIEGSKIKKDMLKLKSKEEKVNFLQSMITKLKIRRSELKKYRLETKMVAIKRYVKFLNRNGTKANNK